ncbi:hypothetical protein K6T82_15560 [Flavobacterium sp. 17A]|uniref:Uncharacterized protein n=1 Tax=Flavobacterium potami TaxID=2872310 RepID=A0A9X1KR51_9FLAO|nr:hypothetical protein [Flavobacterium potami]MBZ4036190.1 hypothetical protein [Flavobacterium potami]
MKPIRILSVVFILFGLFGFRSEKYSLMVKREIPSDFYFVINDGRIDSYNSQLNSFSRKYLEEERVLKIALTEKEKEKIYSLIQKSNFLKMPMKFEPIGEIKIKDPSFTRVIVANVNGERKMVSYNDGWTNALNDKKAKSFLDLYTEIWNVLYEKQELREMKNRIFILNN